MKYIHSWFDKRNTMPIPRFYRLAYEEFVCARGVYYPIPINCIVRYGLKLYFGFLRMFYWIGVIDTDISMCFRWDDFWRIRWLYRSNE